MLEDAMFLCVLQAIKNSRLEKRKYMCIYQVGLFTYEDGMHMCLLNYIGRNAGWLLNFHMMIALVEVKGIFKAMMAQELMITKASNSSQPYQEE